MKSKLFLIPLVALLSACAGNDLSGLPEQESSPVATTRGYMAISLVSPGSLTSRDDEKYKDGNESESKVNMVRLYFFDAQGNPSYIRKNPNEEGNFYSYYDLTEPTSTGFDKDKTIESIYSSMLSLEMPDDPSAGKPAQIVAIVNPPASLMAKGNVTLTTLTEAVDNYRDGLSDSNFVMSNSVHVDNSGNAVRTQAISENNIQGTAALAQSDVNHLTIYVERVLARLDLAVDTSSENIKPVAGKDNTYDIGFEYEPEEIVETDKGIKKKIYVKFLSWKLVSTPVKSNLIKDLNTGWEKNMWDVNGTLPWNTADYHRSFWAYNPEGLDLDANADEVPDHYEWYSYNQLTGSNGATKVGLDFTDSNTAYMHENANPKATATKDGSDVAHPSYPSKVIIAAQLVDANDDPVTICEYMTQYYTVDGLKKVVANNLRMFTPKAGADATTYSKIEPGDIDIRTKSDYTGKKGPDNTGDYYVYFTLTETAKAKQWYHMDDNAVSSDSYAEITNPDQFIYDSVGKAMIWNQGATYFFFNIRHLAPNKDTPGYFGVVRNHIYDSKITSISGLGTPVYKPEEVIFPEQTDRSANILNAQINILQWRNVRKNYEFSW